MWKRLLGMARSSGTADVTYLTYASGKRVFQIPVSPEEFKNIKSTQIIGHNGSLYISVESVPPPPPPQISFLL